MQQKKRNPKEVLKKLYPVFRHILDKVEKEEPDTVTFLNLFNTGIIIDSNRIKNVIIKFLKDSLR